MDTMKALVMRGPNDYSVETMPIPKPGRNEVRVRIKACAICGSDPKLLSGKQQGINLVYPFIPGHEAAGQVVELGEGVSKFAVGDRVAAEAHCGCGQCDNCLQGLYTLCLNYGRQETGHRHYGFLNNGAFAEYCVYNVKALEKIPDGVSYDEATMCDTAGIAYNGIRLINITPGGYTVIVGPGPIGLCALMIARAKGARTIMIGRGPRLEAAGRLGCDYLIDYEKEDAAAAVARITGGRRADEVIECAGNDDAIAKALKTVKRGGKVLLLGWLKNEMGTAPLNILVNDQITLVGGRANPNCSKNVMRMMETGSLHVRDIITHHFNLADIQQGIDTFVNRKEGALKVIIHP